jgi:predicted RNA-binding Zn-ribbon protein involved in translation (DUF1610 family)
MPRGRPKKITVKTVELPNDTIASQVLNLCVSCGREMTVNRAELWADQPDNAPTRWWNTMEFYCPHCHVFQNAGDFAKHQYTQPSGKWLSNGRRIIQLIADKTGERHEPSHE